MNNSYLTFKGIQYTWCGREKCGHCTLDNQADTTCISSESPSGSSYSLRDVSRGLNILDIMSQMPWEPNRLPLISLTCSKQLLTTSKTLYFAVLIVCLPPAASGAPQVHYHDAGSRQKLGPTPGEGFWTKIFTPIASLKQQEPFSWNENMRVEARNYMIFDVNAVLLLLNNSNSISVTRPSVSHLRDLNVMF